MNSLSRFIESIQLRTVIVQSKLLLHFIFLCVRKIKEIKEYNNIVIEFNIYELKEVI